MKGVFIAAASVAGVAAAQLVPAQSACAQTVTQGNAAIVNGELLYRTRRNDTIYDLAVRYMERVSDYRVVQALNRVPVAVHLQPNVVLRIPVPLLKSTPVPATILSFSGAVSIGGGQAPRVGLALPEGTRLQTGPNAFLTLRAVDGSRISMPSNSVMRLKRMRRLLLTGSVDQEYAVESGRVQTSVTPQRDPNSSYRFSTPVAVSAVRGTEFRVAYGTGPSLTEVLGGTVAVGEPGAAASRPVPAGIGAALSPGGGFATEELLPGPVLLGGGTSTEATAAFAFAPVPGAVRYRVQLARDAAFEDIFTEAQGPQPRAEFPGLPDGSYHLCATAFSGTGFEGLPARYAVTRRLVVPIVVAIRPATIDGGLTRLAPGRFRFTWAYDGPGAPLYRFQLLVQPEGGIPLVDLPALRDASIAVNGLVPGIYWWRTGAIVPGPGGRPSEIWMPPAQVRLGP